MSKAFRVVVADFVNDELAPEHEILSEVADVVALDAGPEQELHGRIENADAIMVYHRTRITQATIDRLEQCRVIVRCGVGYDNVDGAAARQRNIPLCNIPDYGTEEVADSAIGITLALTRGISFLNIKLRNPETEWKYNHVAPRHRLRGRTFGIIGLGRIGTATALRAKSIGMNVVFYDPYLRTGYDKAMGVTRVGTLRELLQQSYVVSVHCPNTTETSGMINTEALSHMQRGSYLVNTARGAIVDIAAIPDAIASGQLAGAGIDVFPNEPPPADHPLLEAWRDPQHPVHDRVILNAHAAFYSVEGLLEMRQKASQICRSALHGEVPWNVVNND